MKFERITRFERGHDCIRFECINGSDRCFPGSGGSHGVHGLSIRFVLKGEAGAVQFLLYTGWLPKQANGCGHVERKASHAAIPADLGYHSKTPRYDDQQPMQQSCEYCDGMPCYYDGSGLNAEDAMLTLVNGGDNALWTFLEAYYRCVFEGGEYPKPAEYPKPPRKVTL